MLPPDLRSQFLSSVANSSSQPSAVIQSLLELDDLRNEEHSPWWLEAGTEGPLDLGIPLQAVQVPQAPTRSPPELVAVPAAVRPTLEAAQRVLYNVVAVAYVHCALQTSPLKYRAETCSTSTQHCLHPDDSHLPPLSLSRGTASGWRALRACSRGCPGHARPPAVPRALCRGAKVDGPSRFRSRGPPLHEFAPGTLRASTDAG